MFDPAGDFPNVVDGLEPLTLQRRGAVLGTVAHAWCGPVAEREAAAGGGSLVSSDIHWHLPKAECPASPALGDVLVDSDGGRWTVLAVTESAAAARWNCTCRNLVVAHGLNDVVTIQRAEYAKDAGGAVAEQWHTWRTGVRARIQPLAAQVNAAGGLRRTVRRYRVYLAEDLELDHKCRIVAPDAAVYRIVGSTGAEQIGALQTIEAERIS